jgi:hypothetical protein
MNTSNILRNIERYILVLVFVFGIIIRLFYLDYHSLSYDEVQTYYFSQGTIDEIIHNNASANSAPPTYVFVVALVALFSHSVFFLRLISVAGGVISILAVYSLTKYMHNVPTGLISAFIVASSSIMVEYSQELREYSWSVAVSALILLQYIRFIELPTRVSGFWLATTIVLGIFLQYGLALVVLSINILFVFEVMRRADNPFALKRYDWSLIGLWSEIQTIGIIAVIIVWRVSLRDQLQDGGFGPSTYLSNGYFSGGLESAIELIVIRPFNLVSMMYITTRFMFISLFLFGFFLHLYNRKKRTYALMLIVLFSVNIIAAFLGWYPWVSGRQTLYIAPIVYVTAAFGAYSMAKAAMTHQKPHMGNALRLIAGLGTLVISFAAVRAIQTSISHVTSDGWENIKPIVATLQDVASNADIIYLGCYSDRAFSFYYEGDVDRVEYVDGNQQVENELLQKLLDTNFDNLWMVFSMCGQFGTQETLEFVQSLTGDSPVLVQEEFGAELYEVAGHRSTE